MTVNALSLPGPGSRVSDFFGPRSVAGLSAVLVVLWAVWAAYFNTAQFGDNIEQFNWAQSLELGYHKHPPLPSWALASVVRLFGPSIYWAYVLATACLLGTLAFTWLIARRLLGERVAAIAIVLWGLNMCFSERVQLYNHDTMLVLWVAATVWLAMRATSAQTARPAWWAATGFAAAAAMLSKYQALVPLAGLVIALGLAQQLRTAAQRRGIALALAVFLVAIGPHAVWVVQHDFTTLRYAGEAMSTPSLTERLGFIVSFAANQLRFAAPALLTLLLCFTVGRRDRASSAPSFVASGYELRGWMFGLIGAGICMLILMAMAGVGLRNHWGVQTLQFFSIWLAWKWDRRYPVDLKQLALAALVVHAASLGWYAAERGTPSAFQDGRRIDTMYPARRLAEEAIHHWRETTACPMRYVAGTVFDAGLVSLYSGGHLQVFDSKRATPWVRPEELERFGALYVLDQAESVPEGVVAVVPFELVHGNAFGKPARIIRIGVLPPGLPCH